MRGSLLASSIHSVNGARRRCGPQQPHRLYAITCRTRIDSNHMRRRAARKVNYHMRTTTVAPPRVYVSIIDATLCDPAQRDGVRFEIVHPPWRPGGPAPATFEMSVSCITSIIHTDDPTRPPPIKHDKPSAEEVEMVFDRLSNPSNFPKNYQANSEDSKAKRKEIESPPKKQWRPFYKWAL